MECIIVYDLIVVGGGPGGIFGAIYAKNSGKKVLLLEKMEKLGKKLLLAGSGQCNLTHSGDYKEFLDKYGENGKFLKRALYKYPPEKMIEFFEKRGLKLLCNDKGKYFPETMRALDVLNILKKELDGVEVLVEANVEKVINKGKAGFLCHSSKGIFQGENVLISTGGLSYGVTGSTGDGYAFAKNMGHNIVEPRPALTSCYVKDYSYGDLSGLSFDNIEIEIYRNNKFIFKNKGPFLFTHKNLSGPLIIDASRYMKKEDILSINFVGIDKEEFINIIRTKIGNEGGRQIKNLFAFLELPHRFISKVLEEGKINIEKKVAEITKEEIKFIVEALCQKTFVISKLEGYNNAMATAGGIDLKNINKNTMESKIVKGLYFAGEVLDIDGDTGGYNIQCAYSTGALIGEEI